MKERYVKPDLRVEYFTLSQSVAAGGCGAPHMDGVLGGPNQADKMICGWEFVPGVIAWTANSSCNDIYDPDAPVYGICYNNPEGGFSIFGS